MTNSREHISNYASAYAFVSYAIIAISLNVWYWSFPSTHVEGLVMHLMGLCSPSLLVLQFTTQT